MVWEFIDGREPRAGHASSAARSRRGTRCRLAIQALRGLEAIHRAGIVHRDISPENLMITHDGEGSECVKIIDLGVAKADESRRAR